MKRNHLLWLAWITATLAGGTVIVAIMYYGGGRSFLLIGQTTSAHHQIELACDSCHTSWFGGIDALQKGCMNCHGAELKAANDSHPASKFKDPRNADRVEVLDARYCVTCHREHTPGITNAMAVTMPTDYCALCHEDVAKDRPSHEGLGFDTCASAGCHNFHDNKALYEDFLEKHHKELDFKSTMNVALFSWKPSEEDQAATPKPVPLAANDADAPAAHAGDEKVMAEWSATKHAAAGVNCSGCHMPRKSTRPDEWVASPGMEICATCHATETKTFTEGKHGMRLREGLWVSRRDPFGIFQDKKLTPMTPALARIPMKSAAHDTELACTTCHGAHDFNIQKASVEACLGCHDDEHSKAYVGSPHGKLRIAVLAGKADPSTAVTCATCHMPRSLARNDYGVENVFVMHNQNDNLRPNEKMIRSVCADCHGLAFAIDALADPDLLRNNFSWEPSKHIESIDWVENRMRARGDLK